MNWNARPVLHGASQQGSARNAGQRIHGPTSSWADQPDNGGMESVALTAFRLVQHAQMVHSGAFNVLWEW